MSYKRVKMVGANCPTCQRKLEILLKDDSQEALCICFRCRGIYAFDGQELHKLSNGKQATNQEKTALARLVQALPEKHLYIGKGSQLRQKDFSYQRSWLSLAEYERQFGEALGFNATYEKVLQVVNGVVKVCRRDGVHFARIAALAIIQKLLSRNAIWQVCLIELRAVTSSFVKSAEQIWLYTIVMAYAFP